MEANIRRVCFPPPTQTMRANGSRADKASVTPFLLSIRISQLHLWLRTTASFMLNKSDPQPKVAGTFVTLTILGDPQPCMAWAISTGERNVDGGAPRYRPCLGVGEREGLYSTLGNMRCIINHPTFQTYLKMCPYSPSPVGCEMQT